MIMSMEQEYDELELDRFVLMNCVQAEEM